ncbi:hypothetical protein [Fluviispira vulneris]|uniref:hypothetical protein n=1 Tax=Fluviispira vulneris TaxID=2763012 RepID=UPI00164680B2|nr:hypothetical protein [Fluviispira vulneris]
MSKIKPIVKAIVYRGYVGTRTASKEKDLNRYNYYIEQAEIKIKNINNLIERHKKSVADLNEFVEEIKSLIANIDAHYSSGTHRQNIYSRQ